MHSLRFTLTLAASGDAADTGVSVFWLTVLAIAIMDDGDRRAKKRRHPAPAQPAGTPRPPAGPKVF